MGEKSHLDTSMKSHKEEREKLMDHFSMLKRSMDHATEETQKVQQHIQESEHHHAVVGKQIQQVSRDTTSMLSKIDEEISEQTTVDRAAANSKKRIRKIREDIGQKEVETQNLHNEIARVTVDSL